MKSCDRTSEYLESGGASALQTPPADVAEHLASCDECRRLWDFVRDAESIDPRHLGSEASPRNEVDSELEDRIRRQLLDTLEPVRPLPSRLALSSIFLLIFVVVSALALAASGASVSAAMKSLQLLGMMAAILVSAALAGFWLSGRMAPGDKRWSSASGFTVMLLGALGMAVAAFYPWGTPGDFWAGSFKCFLAGFVFSIPAVAPVAFLISRGYPISLRSVGAVAGLLAGLVGFVFLHLACTVYSAPHILVGHLAAPLVAASVGYLVGLAIESVRRLRTAEV